MTTFPPPHPVLFGSFCLQLSDCSALEPFDITPRQAELSLMELDQSGFYCLVSVETSA